MLLFAHIRFGRFVSDAPSPRTGAYPGPEPRVCFLRGDAFQRPGCQPSSRPLFMSALEEPSPKTTRPLTPYCRSAAPVVGSYLSRPPALASYATLERAKSNFTAEPESSHRPLAIEEPPSRAGWPVTRRWRNDSERLSPRQLPCEPPLIQTAFQPYGSDALRRPTKPRTMPPL
jgi:hypothetical protein